MSKGLFLAFVILVLAATSLAQVSTEPTTANSPGQNAPANAQNSAPPAVRATVGNSSFRRIVEVAGRQEK